VDLFHSCLTTEDEDDRRAIALVQQQAAHLIRVAMSHGVALTRDEEPENPRVLVLHYTPPDEDWPPITLTRNSPTWTVGEVEGFNDPPRFWVYRAVSTTGFIRITSAIAVWRGNPRGEPEGWLRTWDGRYDVSRLRP